MLERGVIPPDVGISSASKGQLAKAKVEVPQSAMAFLQSRRGRDTRRILVNHSNTMVGQLQGLT